MFAVLLAGFVTLGNSGKKLQEQLDLGAKYLDDMDYEQALVVFEAALKIDPKNVDAYIGLADVYVTMGDAEKALEVLAEGYEQTGEKEIRQKIKEVEEIIEAEKKVQDNASNSTGNIQDNEAENTKEENKSSVTFVSWDEAGLEDHVMDWKDRYLEEAMRKITGITDRDIMLSDVWEMTVLYLCRYGISDISALSELMNLLHLDLRFNQICDISVLSGLINLNTLYLERNPINDYSSVEFISKNGGTFWK